jgi:uncharacterized damage-inducible protein DinB
VLTDLQTEYDSLAARWDRFQAETVKLSETQLRFRPAPEGWSIAEVARHMLNVEYQVTRAATKPGVNRRMPMPTPREWIARAMFNAVILFGIRIRIPRAVSGRVTPQAEPDMDALWQEWREVHANLRTFLDAVTAETLTDMAYRHPIVGPTTVKGMLPFLTMHFDHHMKQVSRIRASPGFPRG